MTRPVVPPLPPDSLAERPTAGHLPVRAPMAKAVLTVRDEHTKADLAARDQSRRIQIGCAVARCFALAGLSQKEAAGFLDRDHAQIARWISGAERPQFDRLFAVPRLRQPLLIAFAEMAGDGVEIVTQISLTRIA